MGKNWQRPIVFEGIELPGVTIAIDHLGMYGNLPEISEPTSKWLWHFTVCVGCPNTADSQVIIQHASEALHLAEKFRDRLMQTVPKHFSGAFEPGIVDQWIGALRTITDVAST